VADRRISLSIAPATATTCADGSGKFCPLMYMQRFGTVFVCGLDGTEIGEDAHGWLKRSERCLAAEREAKR
jgi:hypothetical protein